MTKIFLALIVTALVIPESYAKRLGGGRSSGRQSQMSRQRALPPPSVARARPAPQPPPYASRPRQVPGAPAQAQQPARSRLGGFLGGAALGLGLGSVLSSGNAREVAQQDAARAEAARQDAAAQEAARTEKEQEESATGASGQGATGAGGDQPADRLPASGNW